MEPEWRPEGESEAVEALGVKADEVEPEGEAEAAEMPVDSPGGQEPQSQHLSVEGVADEMDRDAVGGDQGSTAEDGQTDRLREEFLEVLGEVRAAVAKARKRPKCQGRRLDSDLLEQVDSLIAEYYDGSDGSLWALNCLVYAGAVVVDQRSKSSRPGCETAKAVRTKEAEVTRKIGWLETEISRRVRSQHSTRRRRVIRARLRRMFGALGISQLRVRLESSNG